MKYKNLKWEKVLVKDYSGYKTPESPRAFVLNGREYKIIDIVDRWYEGGVYGKEPKMDYYKVIADNGKMYILRYNALFDGWGILVSA
ncbi:MAG: hypothetical protein JRI44_07155 [Deltaproteobacteria bacterium]|nr:hypothetical protein [Deltaproteobacteria bacterium]